MENEKYICEKGKLWADPCNERETIIENKKIILTRCIKYHIEPVWSIFKRLDSIEKLKRVQ